MASTPSRFAFPNEGLHRRLRKEAAAIDAAGRTCDERVAQNPEKPMLIDKEENRSRRPRHGARAMN